MTKERVTRRADVLGAVGRGWCSPNNAGKVMDADLAVAITNEVLPLLQVEELETLREARRVFFCPGGPQNFINWLDKRIAASNPLNPNRPAVSA